MGIIKHSKGEHYWRNLFLFTILTLMLGVVAAGAWLAHAKAMGLVHPGRTQPVCTPADRGVVRWEDVRFSSADNLQLAGWFIPPDPRGDGATLIFLHGLGGNRGEFLDEAAMLTEHGYGALLLDMRNHGQSQGTVTTLGYAEVEDVRGAVAYLLARPEVNPQRIGLVGSSMGGSTRACVSSRASRPFPLRHW
jgi:cephalosporin-C deacetylase-like acetyl esterase